MLMANIQNNIMRSHIVTAQQAHMDVQAQADQTVNKREQLDKSNQANEYVRVINQSENEGIRSDHKNPEPHEQPQKRKGRWNAFGDDASEGDEQHEAGAGDGDQNQRPHEQDGYTKRGANEEGEEPAVEAPPHPHLDLRA